MINPEVIINKDDICIIDSYKIKTIKNMKCVINSIRQKCDNSNIIHKRSMYSLINEWRLHNLLYDLHIQRDRTKDVDLNNETLIRRICYSVLSVLYLHFYKDIAHSSRLYYKF